MTQPTYVRWFADISYADVPLVGGKNASLGEMYRELTPLGVRSAERLRDHRGRLPRRADRGRRLGRAARRCSIGLDKTDIARRCRAPAPAAGEIVYAAGLPERARERDPGRLAQAASRSTARSSRSRCAARPPPRTCRPRASPASTTPTSTSAARRCCSTRSGAATRRCSPTARSPTGSTRASTTSRSRSRSACRRWCAPICASSGVMFSLDTETGFPRRGVHHRRLRPRRERRPGRGRPGRVLRPQADLPRRATARCCGARSATRRSRWSMPQGRTREPVLNMPTLEGGARALLHRPTSEVLTLADYAIAIEDHYSRRRPAT